MNQIKVLETEIAGMKAAIEAMKRSEYINDIVLKAFEEELKKLPEK